METAYRAVMERVFYIQRDGQYVVPPKPASQLYFDTNMSKFTELMELTFRYLPIIDEDNFLRTYVGKQLTVYRNAMESLKTRSISKRDAKVACFVKVEKTNFTDKQDPAPRLISPRSPRYHVSIGPTIKTIEKEIYKRIGKVFGSPTVFKGMNASRRGKILKEKWDRFSQPVAIGLDASRFDQHISAIALNWEHRFYVKYNKDKQFGWLLKQQLQNRCYYYGPDGNMSYTTDGTRMSGDMNTSLGNVLIMCGLVYSYMHYCGVKKFELANDGDDCVLIVEAKDRKKTEDSLVEWFETMGFTMKMERHVDVFEEIEFCQSHPVWTPQGYIMVLDPRAGLAKQCVSIKPLDNEKLMKRWLAAVGEGGIALCGGIPIWQEFYKHCYDSAEGMKPLEGDPTQDTGLRRLGIGMKRQYSQIHPATRASFYYAFKISPTAQLSREASIRTTGKTTYTQGYVDKPFVESVGTQY